MEQICLFQQDSSSDPLFDLLQQVEYERPVIIADYKISKNRYGLFEIESREVHECRSSIKGCYEYLCGELVKEYKTRD